MRHHARALDLREDTEAEQHRDQEQRQGGGGHNPSDDYQREGPLGLGANPVGQGRRE